MSPVIRAQKRGGAPGGATHRAPAGALVPARAPARQPAVAARRAGPVDRDHRPQRHGDRRAPATPRCTARRRSGGSSGGRFGSKRGAGAGAASRSPSTTGLTRAGRPGSRRCCRDLGVPATFFVVGEHVIRYPGLVATLRSDGFELGDHTFNHVDLATMPGWERHLQVSTTDTAIAGAAGVRPRFFRPPYSGGPQSISHGEAAALASTVDPGHLIVLSNYDSEDWRRPGVDRIVRNATPPGRRGGVLLFHDGGGDRSETVAALRRLVPRLERRGFRFVVALQPGGSAATRGPAAWSRSERLQGQLLIGALAVARWITGVLVALLIPIAALAVLRALAVAVFARHHARKWRRRPSRPFTPSVSVIVPAFNEAAGIARAVSRWRGAITRRTKWWSSTTAPPTARGDRREPRLPPGASPASTPTRARQRRSAPEWRSPRQRSSSRLTPNGVRGPDSARVVEPFADSPWVRRPGTPRSATGAACSGAGSTSTMSSDSISTAVCTTCSAACRPCRARWGRSGAGDRRRRWFLERHAGRGHRPDDRGRRAGWKVVYVEDARAWTEAPATLSGLWRQRYRWSYGTLQAVWKHRASVAARARQGRSPGPALPGAVPDRPSLRWRR